MGYFSDVAIGMKKKDYDALLEMYKADEDMIYFLTEEPKIKIQDDEIGLLYYGIKWYEGDYKEVTAIMDYLTEIDDYYYLRFGEDYFDYDEAYNDDCDGLMGLFYSRREINLRR